MSITHERSHAERRMFIRHPSCIPLRCLKQGQVVRDPQELRDISLGGLRFATSEAFVPGDLLQVEFPTLQGNGHLKGEVMWVAPDGGNGGPQFTTGMRFMLAQTFHTARILEQVCHIEAYRQAQRVEHGRELTSTEAAHEWIAVCAKRFPGAEPG